MLVQRPDLIYPSESYEIVGAAMMVHRTLGCGFSEKVYQDALAMEFESRGIPFEREVPLHAMYKGVALSALFIPDFICYDKIIVELKAVKEIDDVHRSQAFNYAKVANMRLALLFNFGEPQLGKERLPVF